MREKEFRSPRFVGFVKKVIELTKANTGTYLVSSLFEGNPMIHAVSIKPSGAEHYVEICHEQGEVVNGVRTREDTAAIESLDWRTDARGVFDLSDAEGAAEWIREQTGGAENV
jgi:hypothetical protein